MKLTVNIEKKHAYIIVAALVLLSSLILVIGTGYTAGTASHTTLFTDIITGKNGASVSVMDNVGIGTTNPGAKLHIYDSGAYATMLIDGTTSRLRFASRGSGSSSGGLVNGKNWEFTAQDDWFGAGLSNDQWDGNYLWLSIHREGYEKYNVSLVSRDVLRIQGKVGIEVENPTQKLDVAGNVNAQGLCIGGDCKTAWSQTGVPSGTLCGSWYPPQYSKPYGTKPDIPCGGLPIDQCPAGWTKKQSGYMYTYTRDPTNYAPNLQPYPVYSCAKN